MRAAEGWINVEKENNKKARIDVFASVVMGEMFKPHVDQRRAFIRFVCKELINHPTFKSDLVVGLACFVYVALFTLPKDQAAGFYSRLFHSFCVRGWLANELKNIHMDYDYIEIVDDLRFVFLDELHFGPNIEDSATFLSSGPELAKLEHTSYIFELCCLWLEHMVHKLLCVTLSCRGKSTAEVDLSDGIEPLQRFLLSSSYEKNIYTSAESISPCVELLYEFADRAMQQSYDPWPSVDFHNKSQ